MHPTYVRTAERVLGPLSGPSSSGWYRFEHSCGRGLTGAVHFGKGLWKCFRCATTRPLREVVPDLTTPRLSTLTHLQKAPKAPRVKLPWRPITKGPSKSVLERRCVAYLVKRGVDRQRAVQLRIGYGIAPPWTGLVIHPWFHDDDETLAGWQGRKTYDPPEGHQKTLTVRWDDLPGSLLPHGGGMYLFEQVREGEPVVLCEGPITALSISRVLPAVALLGSVLHRGQLRRLLRRKPSAIYLAFDPDTFEERWEAFEERWRAPKVVEAARQIAKESHPLPLFVVTYPKDFQGDLGGLPDKSPHPRAVIEAALAHARRWKPGE